MAGSEHDVAAWLRDAGVPETAAGRFAAALAGASADSGPDSGADSGPDSGPDLVDRLRSDPWTLLEVPEARPEQADAVARARLGAAARPDDRRRARAVVGWLLRRAARDGHTAQPVTVVLSVLAGLGFPDPEAAVAAALDDGSVLGFAGEPTEEGEDASAEATAGGVLALERYALAEEGLAESLLRLRATARPLPAPGGEGVAEAPAELRDVLAAGAGVLDHGYGPRRAGPVHDLVWLARAHGLRPAVVTPLNYREAGPDADLVVLDEAHLLDVELAAELAEQVPDGVRLVLAGDGGQLPPRLPGEVFRDILASAAVPVVRSRSRPAGVLGELAAAVRDGTLPALNSPDREAVIVPAGSGAEAAHRVVQLVTDSIPRALGFAAADVQVVVPARSGSCGTAALNRVLKQRLNPGPGEFGGFDVGDRVVLTGDLATPEVRAGAIGTVTGKTAEGLLLDVGGRQLTVPRPLTALHHGWAVTVALAAGSIWPAVVVALPGEAAGLLSRPLVYTALTRAERHLSVVPAAGPALTQAVALVPARPRFTRLEGLLRGEA